MLKTSLLLTLIFLLLQGCAAVVVGGAGAAGYYAGKNTKDDREVSTVLDDAGITARINAKLISSKGIKTFDINIDTYKGMVLVEGQVPTKEVRNKIIKLCKLTEGVKKVTSKLIIKKEK